MPAVCGKVKLLDPIAIGCVPGRLFAVHYHEIEQALLADIGHPPAVGAELQIEDFVIFKPCLAIDYDGPTRMVYFHVGDAPPVRTEC